jgi:hypothetical protein
VRNEFRRSEKTEKGLRHRGSSPREWFCGLLLIVIVDLFPALILLMGIRMKVWWLCVPRTGYASAGFWEKDSEGRKQSSGWPMARGYGWGHGKCERTRGTDEQRYLA